MTFVDEVTRNARSVAEMSATLPLCGLAGIGFAVLLTNGQARRALSNVNTLALTLSLFIPWLLLVPYAAAWSDVADRHKLGWWPIIPNWAVLLSWPVFAYRFIRRMRDARGAAIGYITCNAPGCLFTWFITTIIVSADWI